MDDCKLLALNTLVIKEIKVISFMFGFFLSLNQFSSVNTFKLEFFHFLPFCLAFDFLLERQSLAGFLNVATLLLDVTTEAHALKTYSL